MLRRVRSSGTQENIRNGFAGLLSGVSVGGHKILDSVDAGVGAQLLGDVRRFQGRIADFDMFVPSQVLVNKMSLDDVSSF